MKHFFRMSWMLVVAVVLGLTSCLNETDDKNSDASLPGNVVSVSEQVEAMKGSLADIESIQNALAETSLAEGDYAAKLETCATSVEEFIADVEAGLNGVNAVIEAMNLQSEIAAVTGELKASASLLGADASALKSNILSLEKSVKAWLGEDFQKYFEVLSEQAMLETMLLTVESIAISADAIKSDVEAGLRVGDASGLKEVEAGVSASETTLSKLNNEITELIAEVEQVYTSSIKGEDSKTTLKSVNAKAAAALKSSGSVLDGIYARIAACEETLDELNEKLEKIDADVEDLIGMIQSVTFLSDYSEDYAIAYYEMDLNSKVSDPSKSYNGKCVRTPVSTIDLNYMVRPAAAAAAVSKEVVSMLGYYATRLQTKAVDPSMFFDFDVESVSVTNPERGIVTVRVNHNLDEAFYFKEKGAKCALSITSGQTDITSKFVELTPVDNSGKVYVKSVVPSKDVVEIKKGETMTLEATINPSNAANKAVYWASTDTKIVRIDETTGNLLAYGVGTADVQVISRGTDEWGLPVVGTCKVVVTEAVTLTGPAYVEVGKTADLTLDFPGEMLVESKVWWTSEEEKATVADGTVTGVADTYLPYNYDYGTITVYCMINGDITVSHDMKVVVPQPRQIVFNDYDDDEHVISMKLDQSISLAGTIHPAESADKFRLFYESNVGSLGWINSSTGVINEYSNILSPGTVYVYARVFEVDKNHYFAPGNSLWREMIVNVEPYYVESITLPATMNLAPGATATLTPSFTSDVDGKQPTNTSLTWTSSNPSIVSIDSETGEMKAEAEGTVTITATTKSGTTSDSSVKTATCIVTVKTPVAEVKIGDYYYSDGTWGSSANPSGKTVIGVIFSNANAVASDPILARDYPKCSNGLVISTREYSRAFGDYSYSDMNSSGIALHLDGSTLSRDIPNGYGLTMAYGKYRNTYISSKSYCEMFDVNTGLPATHTATVAPPSTASAWYVPSYFEMLQMYENKADVNAALAAVSGDQLENKGYIHATLWTTKFDGRNYDDCSSKYFDMSAGGWGGSYLNGSPCPVRVVLAF